MGWGDVRPKNVTQAQHFFVCEIVFLPTKCKKLEIIFNFLNLILHIFVNSIIMQVQLLENDILLPKHHDLESKDLVIDFLI